MATGWPITPETKFHGTDIVRKRAYWSILAGAFGYTYGHANVWCMISEKERNAAMPIRQNADEAEEETEEEKKVFAW